MQGSARVWFATSNDHKFLEATTVLSEFGIAPRRLRAKGTEIQSNDVARIASQAASQTYVKYRRPLFVEDTGLFVDALGGFPGTYASHVFSTIGASGLLTLLAGRADRGAEFVSAVAYVRHGEKPRCFVGRLRGSISRTAAGSHGFGFDPVFVPDGETRTLAEMSLQEKCRLSHRALALRALGSWLTSRFSR